MTIVFG
jgi:hypothetical protein